MHPQFPPVTAYHFGPFRLSVPDRILECAGERIQLTPKVIDTLFVLVENAKQVVAKEDLMKAVWPGVNVVESGLTRNISSLRKALEEGQKEGTYIETIPRRGYRFVADVTLLGAAALPPEVSAPSAKSSSRWLRMGVPVVACLIGLAIVFLFERSREQHIVEPEVRIGEHLLYKLAPDETLRASEHFERAIIANPSSPGAHAGHSISLIHLMTLGVRTPNEALTLADRSARRAVELDPRHPMAHYALALVFMMKDWDFFGAESELQHVLQLDPNSVQGRFGYSRLKQTTGDLSAAQRLVEEALQLDPASPSLGTEYCRVFYFLRDFRRSESECRKVLDRESGYALAHYYLGLNLGWLGRFEEARQSLARSGLHPVVVEADLAWLDLRQGRRKPAEAVLEGRRELVRQGKVEPIAKLLPAAILGRLDEAYEAADSGIEIRAPEMLNVHIEPRLDAMRSDARYPSILKRIGLPNY